jgi:hypothetical protein
MTGYQRLALQLLDDADGMVDTHQLRLKLTLATGREWTYHRTHRLLVRLLASEFVVRMRPANRSVSRWNITNKGRSMLEGLL